MLAEPSCFGLQIEGLYEYRVAVENESDAERNRAFRDALKAVLLKVTGERRWLQSPVLQQAIGNAQSYVEAISYSSELVEISSDVIVQDQLAQVTTDQRGVEITNFSISSVPEDREKRYINVSFAQSLLDDLLASADIPIWDSNRQQIIK
jgi:hypothetical protein